MADTPARPPASSRASSAADVYFDAPGAPDGAARPPRASDGTHTLVDGSSPRSTGGTPLSAAPGCGNAHAPVDAPVDAHPRASASAHAHAKLDAPQALGPPLEQAHDPKHGRHRSHTSEPAPDAPPWAHGHANPPSSFSPVEAAPAGAPAAPAAAVAGTRDAHAHAHAHAHADTDTDTDTDVEKQAGARDDGRPRRGVPKRPEECGLRGQKLAFGAPLPDSGCMAPVKPSAWDMWRIPGPLGFDSRQGWYLLIFHVIGAVIISAAANFGVACAMYRKHSIDSITMWKLQDNTIAGDMAVTILIQGTATFVITSTMVHRDLYKGIVAPLRRPWPNLLHLPSTPSPQGTNVLGTRLPSQVPPGQSLPMGPLVPEGTGGFKASWLWFWRFIFCGTERNDILAPSIGFGQRCQRFVWTVVQGLGVSALVVWAPFWGISLCIVAPIWTGHQMAGTWVGPAIKCTYGGILALVMNPFICLFAMGAEYNVKRAYPELQLWQNDLLAPINQQTVPKEQSESLSGAAPEEE